ncbi:MULTISPECIES: dihydrodipicolinate synthase family protein [Mammaliicoccus]|uniref:dihydrodipicolinate synthase family protein n=1 Tax=Mammaliicoccus TaxID=2803850 RepID=UPI000D1D57CA|nr:MULTISPECIES: dihydrodipicolinate synthase family protein [Mammaliicoccus]PTI89636.1 dihydrodipicolinate synthase family protein [Mammaliicoccus vitulinus]QJF24241.1 dihydrodipicolinate synthase family protein [Mammaliicoccus vitulinus]QQT15335.1 dihydrodipicolinate synthase family protein [Mammaliicoccus vitulinus]QQY19363.1 dihydrodipicolinate synthase family protein [Mammaliicoccus vitulinus]RIN16297.1 dihydrodipicolinate synthase family protein [Mammaliicoccus vitulinus]
MKNKEKWSGVFPAILVPFNDDDSIDEQSFRDLVRWVANHDGVKGIVVNGHTGEIMTLLPEERAKIVSLAVDELQGKLPVISGVSAEGTIETIQHAQAVEKAGGEGILLMPPHSWLRFSMQDDSPSNYFKDVADAINIGIVVHQYPADTKASYSTEQLLKMAKIPNVVAFKLGERDMATYELHVRNLQKEAPDCAILTCHDEYLLPTLVQGIEGALVGFGCFVPDLISDLVHHVKNNDIASAKNTYDEIFKLKHAIYKMDQPSSSSHLRMKEAMYQRGIIKTNHARKPVEPLTQEEKDEITEGLKTVGLIN